MIVIPMIIIATRCCTADPITLTHYRLFSNNATYCRLSSPRVAARPIKLLSFTVDCSRTMRLTADYCRHALLHGRSNYCHSLSIVVEQCDLLPIMVATRYSTAEQSVTHYRFLSTIIATRIFPRSVLFFGETRR